MICSLRKLLSWLVGTVEHYFIIGELEGLQLISILFLLFNLVFNHAILTEISKKLGTKVYTLSYPNAMTWLGKCSFNQRRIKHYQMRYQKTILLLRNFRASLVCSTIERTEKLLMNLKGWKYLVSLVITLFDFFSFFSLLFYSIIFKVLADMEIYKFCFQSGLGCY